MTGCLEYNRPTQLPCERHRGHAGEHTAAILYADGSVMAVISWS